MPRSMRAVMPSLTLIFPNTTKIATRFAQEQTESLSFLKSGIETQNAAFNTLIEQIERVAIHSKSPLLLMGPTGAGKSQLARRIYELKKARRQGELDALFVEVNCATIRGDAAMSALFGHVKGAFTGALASRPGLLRAAHGGVLLLDEVGELGLDEQAMLLRALEEKRFLPVGSDVEIKSDFQLIAGTNKDLALAVEAREFRDDLLARINLWTFTLPALKDRKEDIEPNLAYELQEYARLHGNNVTFNKEARDRFLAFATSAPATWRRNFRDLNAAINRMATLSGGAGSRITVEVVEQEIRHLTESWRTDRAGGGGGRAGGVRGIGGGLRPSTFRGPKVRRWTGLIWCSWRKYCACARLRGRCRMRGGRSLRHLGRRKRRPMMRIACASIWLGLAWCGRIFIRSKSFSSSADQIPRRSRGRT